MTKTKKLVAVLTIVGASLGAVAPAAAVAIDAGHASDRVDAIGHWGGGRQAGIGPAIGHWGGGRQAGIGPAIGHWGGGRTAANTA